MGISDAKLRDIANGLEQGQWDADLGGDVYKVRIARPGEGKSGGFRTIVLFRKGEKTFFVYGFAKSDRGNIADDELQDLKYTSKIDFALTNEGIDERLKEGSLIEIV
jgi:hypothetical protein